MKLRIVNIDKYDYTLQDEFNNTYTLNIEFFDLVEMPKAQDYIYLTREILKENNFFSFSLTEREGLLKLKIKNNIYYLERIFG